MRDEPLSALGKNLAQEPWDFNFFHYCLKRSGNHGHIEDYGKLVGCIAVAASKPTKYEFATFRDHSWDMRVWAAIDHIFILLMALRTPLKIDGVEYTYLNVTLVSLKGNPIGLQKFTTGYLAGPRGTCSLRRPRLLMIYRLIALPMACVAPLRQTRPMEAKTRSS